MRVALSTILALVASAAALQAQGTAAEYQAACDSGDLVHCAVVGLIHQTGANGARDLERAVGLYERACDREVMSACARLGFLEEAGAPPDDDRVRVGYVADAHDGAPLGGAVVRVRGGAGIGERRYLSDSEGRIVLDPLPYGNHPIDVQRGGYQGAQGEIPVPWEGDFLILLDAVAETETATVGRIFGQVVDETTGAGIPEVDITVTWGAFARTMSNREGRFLIDEIARGQVEIRFERLGYEPRTTTVTVEGGRTLDVLATMSARPIELEPVQVSVASRYLERSGYYHRAQSTSGDRFTFREIEEMNVMEVADILRRVGNVTVVTSQVGPGAVAISNRRRGGDAPFARCYLQPYFNGTPLASFELEIVPPEEIEAIEVYQGANVPIQYLDTMQMRGTSCGVVLIWTRDPRRSR